MSDNRDFGFCPRCGALMQNGVCISCGRGAGRQPQMTGGYQAQDAPGMSGNPGNMPNGSGVTGGPGTGIPYIQVTPAKQKNHTVAIVIGVTVSVLAILGLIIALLVYVTNSAKSGMNSERWSSDRDYYNDDYYDDDYSYYEPDEDDPYYREIVDCTHTDLDYHIQWAVESMDPDDPEDECTYYTTYPLVEKEGTRQFDTVNETIRKLALTYRDTYKEYAGGASTFGYVTLMDEEKISIVFKHNIYKENVTEVRLDALTFWIETGEQVKPEEMTEIDRELAMRFQSQDKLQNDGVEYVQNLTADELLEVLKDKQRAVFFYTPVGLEVGLNYETGWVTVTIKEQAL